MMNLALSYDHRIVDGRDAVTFLVRVKECLEDPQRFVLEVSDGRWLMDTPLCDRQRVPKFHRSWPRPLCPADIPPYHRASARRSTICIVDGHQVPWTDRNSSRAVISRVQERRVAQPMQSLGCCDGQETAGERRLRCPSQRMHIRGDRLSRRRSSVHVDR